MNVDDRLTSACLNAITIWGVEPQMRMLQEECGELIAAVNRLWRGRTTDDALAEEIADVTIMLRQAAIIAGAERVEAAMLSKLQRLEARLDGARTPGTALSLKEKL